MSSLPDCWFTAASSRSFWCSPQCPTLYRLTSPKPLLGPCGSGCCDPIILLHTYKLLGWTTTYRSLENPKIFLKLVYCLYFSFCTLEMLLHLQDSFLEPNIKWSILGNWRNIYTASESVVKMTAYKYIVIYKSFIDTARYSKVSPENIGSCSGVKAIKNDNLHGIDHLLNLVSPLIFKTHNQTD